MNARRSIRRVANRFGVDIVAFRPDKQLAVRRQRLFDEAGVTLVADIGANSGQYARRLRQQGYAGRIVSFEPLSHAFAELEAAARTDGGWEVHRLALGDRDETATINVAANSESSSLLPMTAAHVAEAPESEYVSTEQVDVRRVDSILAPMITPGEKVHLKLDVQGYELPVLNGAAAIVDNVVGIECELSLLPLYDGQALIEAIVDHLAKAGFAPVAVESAFASTAGHVIQLDGLFARVEALPKVAPQTE